MGRTKPQKRRRTPAEQASKDGDGAGNGGIVPPVDSRWKPGQSGNPKGRPSAGASIREWINDLVDRTEGQIRKVAQDRRAPAAKRAAAERLLGALQRPNMSCFEPFLDGKATLSELAATGVDTSVVKKAKQRSRTFTTKDGVEVTEVEREIELLHDRGGQDFDRVCDRTEGRPRQALEMTGEDGGPLALIVDTNIVRGQH